MSLKGILNFLLIILFVVGCYNIVTGKVEGTSRITYCRTCCSFYLHFIWFVTFSSSSTLVKSITSATTHTTIEKDDLSTSKETSVTVVGSMSMIGTTSMANVNSFLQDQTTTKDSIHSYFSTLFRMT